MSGTKRQKMVTQKSSDEDVFIGSDARQNLSDAATPSSLYCGFRKRKRDEKDTELTAVHQLLRSYSLYGFRKGVHLKETYAGKEVQGPFSFDVTETFTRETSQCLWCSRHATEHWTDVCYSCSNEQKKMCESFIVYCVNENRMVIYVGCPFSLYFHIYH